MATVAEILVRVALGAPKLDETGDVLARAVNGAYAAAGPRGRQLRDMLNGTWLGHPLHPALTDVPAGAWTAALLLDACGERRAAKIAIGVGLLGAFGAVASGVTDWLDTYGTPRRLGVAHAVINGTATALYVASYFTRDRSRRLGVQLSLAGYGLVCLGALYGGTLSLDMHVGVNHAHDGRPPEDEVDAGLLSEIPDGGMRRVDANGYPVLLVRRGTEVFAIGAVCAHQGGPLEEGSLDGDVVSCPWHQSQFCVRDGSIVHGPTAYPQPSFNVRVSGERVMLAGLQNEVRA
jgi:nitrite reductase/ring-hydroxylating ferredoxin subunit/uncharacterized membrane protein